jgi:hypothetical protein
MKRYGMRTFTRGFESVDTLIEVPYGEWVRFGDVEKLQAELATAKARVLALEHAIKSLHDILACVDDEEVLAYCRKLFPKEFKPFSEGES